MKDIIEEAVIKFATKAHGQQKRKYTLEPYINHCINVAGMVKENGGTPSMVYAAILHDVIEDTTTSIEEIYNFLVSLHILPFIAQKICNMVSDLTDQYTKEAYPKLNRKQRKELECARLARINPKSQTIKYCDLIDNAGSITQHDESFAETYLKEKRDILRVMDKGDYQLYMCACNLCGFTFEV